MSFYVVRRTVEPNEQARILALAEVVLQRLPRGILLG